MAISRIFWCLLLALGLVPTTGGQAASREPVSTRLELYRSHDPDHPAVAVFFLTPATGWHVYGNVPGDAGYPTSLRASLNGRFVPTFYPPATNKPDPLDPTLSVDLYQGRTPLFIPLALAETLDVQTHLEALLCSDTTCQPLRGDFRATASATELANLPLAESQDWWPQLATASPGVEESDAVPAAVPEADLPPVFDFKPRYFAPGLEVSTLSKAATLAFLAGLILNFMPCVLPVITLKLRSFIPAANSVATHQRQAFRTHNLFFALGVVLYFVILATIIAMTGMAWGQIFQQPGAIITLAAVVFALSLSLFGVYDLPLIDLKGHARGVAHHPRLESFTTGVLATILATPCSGPFLGGVLAWALIQPPRIIALVLACIGLGMAAPYLLMALLPGLYRFLPQPGAWTIHLERVLGFLLAGTTVYLIGLLPTTQYLNVLILLWMLALGAWIWGKWTNLSQTRTRRWFIRVCALGLVAGTAFLLFRPVHHPDAWNAFDLDRFKARLGHETLVLEFTADWCPNCKFLEKTVLSPERSARLTEDFDIELMRVDLTRHDPTLMALLESLGSKSIPVLAIFPKDAPQSPLVLRDLFTSGQLREALGKEHE